MRVRVSGKQIEIGEALPEKVRARLAIVIEKHFDGGARANVVFSKEAFLYCADCTVHLDSGVILKSEGQDADVHRSFDAALVHLEKQIRRYKRRLKNHREKVKARPRAEA
ncbi:MAG TPA: ribosome-associated translation inhibitor RaiA [Rhizomicrobium sp.]|nr:ribosome-associated translation inhibitor RaiA [Rhizomicrobium sp.]